jgi:DNA-directed RNA polymerase I, II, and III subunit RPABC2
MVKLTKFECVRLVGQRAEYLASGAPAMVDTTGMTDALTIAEKELAAKKIPLTVRRIYPDGSVVEISVMDPDTEI